MDKVKFTKWVKEEVQGCESRGETERANAMQELLLKIERGYFDSKQYTSVPNNEQVSRFAIFSDEDKGILDLCLTEEEAIQKTNQLNKFKPFAVDSPTVYSYKKILV